MKILLSSSLDSSEGEEAMINDRLCWLEVSSWSLSSLQRLENVRQFSYSCLCFPSTRFLLDLTQRIRGSEKYTLHVHCALNLVGSCFVMCTQTACVQCPWYWNTSSFLFLLMRRASETSYLHHVLPVKGFLVSWKETKQEHFFFLHMLGNSVFLRIVFLMSCFFPNVSYLVLRLFCS